MAINYLGPILLSDPARDTTKTAGQITFSSSYDSRLAQRRVVSYARVREILLDATVQLARQAIVAPMIHTTWEYVSEATAPDGAAQYIQDNLADKRDWLLQNAVYGALDFGWAPFELIYEVKDGRIMLKEAKQLLHEFTTILVYVDTGRFAGFVNEPITLSKYAGAAQVLVPYAANFVLSVSGTDWYGNAITDVLDSIVEAWTDVNNSANRYDKKIAGATWVVYYPVGSTSFNGELLANDEIAKRLLVRLEASGALAIPDEVQEFLDDSIDREMRGKWRVELISATGQQAGNFIDRLKYLDNLKIRAFGIPERAILEGNYGTKAEAEVHGHIALSTINTKHRLLCEQVNRYIVQPLLRFQYGEKYQNTVRIRPAPLVEAQFQTIKEIYRLLVQSPQVIAEEVRNIDVKALRDQIGIPTAKDATNEFGKLVTEQDVLSEGEG